jgi:hypothetical protein
MEHFNIETYFSSLRENTIIIDVSYKNLTYLPNLSKFKYLEVLICDNNKLRSLPSLPETLVKLYCNNNLLSSLPSLPESLLYLNCNYNNLISLPTLPKKLYYLKIVKNPLTSLPTLPKFLDTWDMITITYFLATLNNKNLM